MAVCPQDTIRVVTIDMESFLRSIQGNLEWEATTERSNVQQYKKYPCRVQEHPVILNSKLFHYDKISRRFVGFTMAKGDPTFEFE
jgi:hypothetical protein